MGLTKKNQIETFILSKNFRRILILFEILLTWTKKKSLKGKTKSQEKIISVFFF